MSDISISGQINNGDNAGSIGVKLNLPKLQLGFEISKSTQFGNNSSSSTLNISIDGISSAFWIGVSKLVGELIPLVPAF